MFSVLSVRLAKNEFFGVLAGKILAVVFPVLAFFSYGEKTHLHVFCGKTCFRVSKRKYVFRFWRKHIFRVLAKKCVFWFFLRKKRVFGFSGFQRKIHFSGFGGKTHFSGLGGNTHNSRVLVEKTF